MQKMRMMAVEERVRANLRKLAKGDVLAFDSLLDYLRDEYVKPEELLPYLIKCFEKISRSEPRKYAISDIVEAREALEAIGEKKNPYFRYHTIKVFEEA